MCKQAANLRETIRYFAFEVGCLTLLLWSGRSVVFLPWQRDLPLRLLS